ncbi:MAG: desulfoferrodoxin [Bacilli bacterium]|nr:desulfoferrodoxin [Bacilli bacterium]
MKEFEFYHDVNGNVVALLAEGKAPLGMTKIEPKAADVGQEKHIPVVKHEGGVLKTICGEVPHPMTPEHHISWFAVASEDKISFVYIPTDGPAEACFPEVEHGVAYSYCNLHGLWKKEF